MREIILFAHTSLDSYVSGPKGELNDFPAGEENLDFVCKLTETSDTAMFGRISYQILESYWPAAKDLTNASKGTVTYSNWYNSEHKIVISKTLTGSNLQDTTIFSDKIINEILRIKKQNGKQILIFGSPTLSQLLLKHDVIDRLRIFINPIVLGRGISLFENSTSHFKLKLLLTKAFMNGEMAVAYIPYI